MNKLLFFCFSILKCCSLFYLVATLPTTAQVIPDITLPNNSNVASENDTSTITGGTQAGGNLFHSFKQFSIPTGGTAYFNNAVDIQNIFSRVTGRSISNIDGLIQANGTANFFLLNPNGIIFGPNAKLNVGGSFIGSTASSLNFADGTQFSATTPQTTPLLTMKVPIGLQYGETAGNIINQSQATGSGGETIGLQVQPSKTLALVGGDVILERGHLTAPGGQIEIGSVSANSGIVSLTPNSEGWILGYEGVNNFNNIQLTQQTVVNASGEEGGGIHVQGAQLKIDEGSQIFSTAIRTGIGKEIFIHADQVDITNGSRITTDLASIGTGTGGNVTIQTEQLRTQDSLVRTNNYSSTGSGGNLNITATDTIDLRGYTSISTSNQGAGFSGDLAISTKRLSVRDGAQLGTVSYTLGSLGNISLNASDSVEVVGFFPSEPRIRSSISTVNFGSGEGGNFLLSTGKLTIANGAALGSVSDGVGKGGNVTVNATDSVNVSGLTPDYVSSALSSTALSFGNAGQLNINTQKLTITDGGSVSTSTLAEGNGGNIFVNASQYVKVSGKLPGPQIPIFANLASSADLVNAPFQETYEVPDKPSGNSGSVKVNTDRLIVTEGGSVNVRNLGSGDAGILDITARSVMLNNEGGITAETAEGSGGEIFLRSRNLRLRNNSVITATAGGSKNGGNITINTGALAALENSDITARAFRGLGGNIQITTEGIFGTQYRKELTPSSDINVSSTFGLEGTVDILSLGFDVQNTLTPLQTNFISPDQAVTGSCLARRNTQLGSFVVTGSGGLPVNPYSKIEEWESLTEVKPGKSENFPLPQLQSSSSRKITAIYPKWEPGNPIIEAQTIVVTANGQTLLEDIPQQVEPKSIQSLTCRS